MATARNGKSGTRAFECREDAVRRNEAIMNDICICNGAVKLPFLRAFAIKPAFDRLLIHAAFRAFAHFCQKSCRSLFLAGEVKTLGFYYVDKTVGDY